MRSSRQVQVTDGGMELNPGPAGENLLFHDGNDRDLERIMQDVSEPASPLQGEWPDGVGMYSNGGQRLNPPWHSHRVKQNWPPLCAPLLKDLG